MLIPYPPTDGNRVNKAWHNAVGSMLFQLKHLEVTGPGLK